MIDNTEKPSLADRVRARAEKKAQVEGTTKTKPNENNTIATIGGDGTVEVYPAPFEGVTDEMRKQAEALETRILEVNGKVTKNYLEMARDLSTFNANKLYLARGYSSFNLWAQSPELQQVGWRTAYDLVRIADEVLPMMERNNLLEEIPSISNLYALLPILNDDDGEAKFLKAIEAIKGQSSRDAKETIREIRGISGGGSKTTKTFFNFRVNKQTADYKTGVMLSGLGGEFAYEMGKLRIAAKDWATFEAMVGEKNIIWPSNSLAQERGETEEGEQ